MKYAVDKWLELDRVQQAQSQKIREMQERELEEVRRAAREAVEKVSSTSEAMRTAESNAKLWEARAREVRADLEFTQQQLQDVQSEMARISSSGSGSSYGSSYGSSSSDETRRLEAERAAAVQKAEEAFHRLRQGEERANAQLQQAKDELEQVKRMATDAARDGGARISHLEEGVSVLQARVQEKEVELQRSRENLNHEIEGLRCDVEDARKAIIQRDQHLRSAMQERDTSYVQLQERDTQLDERTRERDEARNVADERQNHIHHVEKERDELYEKFESTIYDVQQKSGFKNILLEHKLQAINESLEKKESQLSEVIHAANLDPNLLGTVSKKLDDVLDAKNGAIKDLQYELARVTKAHNDVIRVYESKLTEFGIPVEELGFRPLVTSTGTGPAGLVVS